MSLIRSNLRDEKYQFVLNTVTSVSESSFYVPLRIFRERVRVQLPKIGCQNDRREPPHSSLRPFKRMSNAEREKNNNMRVHASWTLFRLRCHIRQTNRDGIVNLPSASDFFLLIDELLYVDDE